jgi:hypothetical protein
MQSYPGADPELVELYADDSGLPPIVCAAFIRADLEPPSRERVDRIGYTAAESRLIAPLLTTTSQQEADLT